MNLLLGVNYKFFVLQPKRLIEEIKKLDRYKLVKGMEIYMRPGIPTDFE